jgi:hypothetical protein
VWARSEDPSAAPLVKVVAIVVLALMAVSTGYTAWIALANFGRIGV